MRERRRDSLEARSQPLDTRGQRQDQRQGTVYFDHAATSWPKPREVVHAVTESLVRYGGNPGRGAYTLALETGRAVLEARDSCARLLGVRDSADMIFTPSCTFGCNLMLKGFLQAGDRVVVGGMEHNSVARPLAALSQRGVHVEIVRPDSTGYVDPDDVEKAVRRKATKAVVCQHASNVSGTIQAVGDMADIAHQNGAVMLVDGAQGAGHLQVDLAALGADAYAASGHKGLLGPKGVGLLYLAPGFDPAPLIEGGTGGGSSGEAAMPTERPDRYEAGTLNVPGALGLGAAASFLGEQGREIHAEEARLTRMLLEGLAWIPGIRILGPEAGVERIPVVSVVHSSIEPDRIAFELDRRFGIACRAGLHCAPWAHDALGTGATGAVRFGIGYGNTGDDVTSLLRALSEVVA